MNYILTMNIIICILLWSSPAAIIYPDTEYRTQVDSIPMINNKIVTAHHTPNLDALDVLQMFLCNDTTDDHVYIRNSYNCMDFSIQLASALETAGYPAGVVKISKGGKYHMIVWVDIGDPYGVMYVEPILDEVYNPAVYCADGGVFTEATIAQAEKDRDEVRSWGK